MRARIIAIIIVVCMLLVCIPVGVMADDEATPPVAAQQPVVQCDPVVGSRTIIIRCTAAGIVVLNTSVNIPTITLPPIPGPTKTMQVPGPIKTVRVPGPTRTATVTLPGPTKTINNPGGTRTEFVTRTSSPTTGQKTIQGPTETVTQYRTRQPAETDGTVGANDDQGAVEKIFKTTPAKIIGISTLTLLLLSGLGLLALWLGYVLGYKDADRENANFMAALSDRMIVRGKRK